MNKEEFKKLLNELDLAARVRIGVQTPGGTDYYFGKFFAIEAEGPGMTTGPIVQFVVEDDIPHKKAWYLYKIVSIEQWIIEE